MKRFFSSVVWSAVFLAASFAHAAAEPTQRWALLIGIDDYAELEHLKFAGADMRSLQQELLAAGFEDKSVFLLEDRATQAKYRPSKGNIEKQLNLLLTIVEKDDLVLVAFSGHGVHLDGKSYLCPDDASLDDADTLISLDGVYDRLRRCPAALKLLVVDACRDDPRLSGGRGTRGGNITNPFAADLERPPQGLVLLSSCAPGQVSREDEKVGHGVFMHFLIGGLHGQADRDRDGHVSLDELAKFAGLETKRHVAREFNAVQTPKLLGDLSIEALALDLGKWGGLPRPSSTVGRASSPSLPPTTTNTDGLGSPPHDDAPHGKAFTNSLGMKFKLIPAGEFMMGTEESQAELDQAFGKLPAAIAFSSDDEHPRHRVRISKPFFLGVYEVRKSDFARFAEATDYQTDAERDGKGGWGWDGAKKDLGQRSHFNWRNWGVNQDASSPVVNVSWNDATAFCQWLSGKEGRAYRLPTEAEWEYACRAGTTTRFYFGDGPAGLARVANVADQSLNDFWRAYGKTATYGKWFLQANDGYALTAPVGRFRANAFGLYDMHGNACEWCADWYGKDYYESSPAADPKGPAAGSFRVIRGGGWNFSPVYCRSAYRNRGTPAYRYHYVGFRVVCEGS
ncbi:MAG TPA: SUMF1/EgtB/PvdO family nonheme iron enzyme [Pirellulales bacterium]|nr:SUMF1/EgtB/PvdO family nonheme iron enzyme [Pirellulales bacterium]